MAENDFIQYAVLKSQVSKRNLRKIEVTYEVREHVY